ncbi:hypothetical protein RJT34_20615 [Clitoria ternatea]|uniref:Uncharacterized protein n=1 Tax=Clitoria ternatea TaxID=43366 RepID=A0AAN9IT60_CLITE
MSRESQGFAPLSLLHEPFHLSCSAGSAGIGAGATAKSMGSDGTIYLGKSRRITGSVIKVSIGLDLELSSGYSSGSSLPWSSLSPPGDSGIYSRVGILKGAKVGSG